MISKGFLSSGCKIRKALSSSFLLMSHSFCAFSSHLLQWHLGILSIYSWKNRENHRSRRVLSDPLSFFISDLIPPSSPEEGHKKILWPIPLRVGHKTLLPEQSWRPRGVWTNSPCQVPPCLLPLNHTPLSSNHTSARLFRKTVFPGSLGPHF